MAKDSNGLRYYILFEPGASESVSIDVYYTLEWSKVNLIQGCGEEQIQKLENLSTMFWVE